MEKNKNSTLSRMTLRHTVVLTVAFLMCAGNAFSQSDPKKDLSRAIMMKRAGIAVVASGVGLAGYGLVANQVRVGVVLCHTLPAEGLPCDPEGHLKRQMSVPVVLTGVAVAVAGGLLTGFGNSRVEKARKQLKRMTFHIAPTADRVSIQYHW